MSKTKSYIVDIEPSSHDIVYRTTQQIVTAIHQDSTADSVSESALRCSAEIRKLYGISSDSAVNIVLYVMDLLESSGILGEVVANRDDLLCPSVEQDGKFIKIGLEYR